MISAAAHSLGAYLDAGKEGAAVLPPVDKLGQFSKTVAVAVAQCAVDQGLNGQEVADVTRAVADGVWEADYQAR